MNKILVENDIPRDRKTRIEWCDIFKGICILLIVVGHVTGRFDDYIYQFHVAAFFFISGYTNRGHGNIFEEIIKKVATLLLPYYFLNLTGVTIIHILEQLNIAGFFSSGVYQTTLQGKILEVFRIGGTCCEWFGATWFLVVMFWATCFFDIEIRLIKGNRYVLIFLCLFLFCLSLFSPDSTWQLALKAQYYMSIGYLIKDVVKKRSLTRILLKILFVVIIWYIAIYKGICNIMDWPSFAFNGLFDMFVPFFGIAVVMYISQIIEYSRYIKRVFLYLGKNTMGVMCFHFLGFKIAYLALIAFGKMDWMQFSLLTPTANDSIAEISFITIISVVVSLVIWNLLGQVKITRILCGKWSKEELIDLYDGIIVRQLRKIYELIRDIIFNIVDEYKGNLTFMKRGTKGILLIIIVGMIISGCWGISSLRNEVFVSFPYRSNRIQFGTGWYEQGDSENYRWVSKCSEFRVILVDHDELKISGYIPSDIEGASYFKISLNGKEIYSQNVEKNEELNIAVDISDYISKWEENIFVLETDGVKMPKEGDEDQRALSMLINVMEIH